MSVWVSHRRHLMNAPYVPDGLARSNDRGRLLVAALAILVLAFSLRIASFSHEPAPDELYHLLAAQSWVEDGSFAIADGQYVRAPAFTRIVGVVATATGGDLDSIRIFCVVLGTIFVLAVFLGVRLMVGDVEALIAATMMALMPGAIFLSQFVRFYSLHALAFWLASIALYVLVTRKASTPARAIQVAVIAALLLFAVQLQITTIVGIVALSTWLIAISLLPAWRWYLGKGRPARNAAIAVLVLIVIGGIFAMTGPLEHLVESYRSSSLWSADTSAGYYAIRYRNQYGMFWSLLPAAAAVALLANWRPAFFCLTVFATAFVLHSFAGMRSERYLFYAMPFFAATWGITLKDLCGRFHAWFRDQLAVRKWPGNRAAGIVSAVVVGVSVLWMVLLTPATELSVRLALDKPGLVPRYWFNYVTSWESAQERIRTLVEASDVFVTSQGHHAIYYIGDFDVEISATGLSDFQSRPGGSDIDPRTGRRVIAEAHSLKGIVACNASGVVVVDQRSWRSFIGVRDDVADFIEANLQAVPTPTAWGMVIHHWSAGDSALNDKKRQWRNAGTTCAT